MNATKSVWVGRVLSGLAILFLVFDGVLKFFLDKLPPEAMADSEKLAWAMADMPKLGVILLTSTLLYAIPRTAVFGAILLTGYLGGAVATHMRVDNPLATHTLFPVFVALFVWGGLFFRSAKIRDLLPIAKM